MKNNWILTVILLIAGLIAGYLIGKSNVSVPFGSVTVGNEYSFYTTSTVALDKQIKTGWGTLGSVVITATGVGAFDLLDATTTDVTKRTGNKATSTILLASFSALPAAGTYVFDETFTTGLLLDINATNIGTTTITYR